MGRKSILTKRWLKGQRLKEDGLNEKNEADRTSRKEQKEGKKLTQSKGKMRKAEQSRGCHIYIDGG